jgi:hypothetical protein
MSDWTETKARQVADALKNVGNKRLRDLALLDVPHSEFEAGMTPLQKHIWERLLGPSVLAMSGAYYYGIVGRIRALVREESDVQS